MKAAFEDCVVLDECLAEFPDNRERAFAEYFARRKENADALADLAVENFIEMRDKTASRTFRAKKKLDHALEAALPGIYLRSEEHTSELQSLTNIVCRLLLEKKKNQ